MSCRSSRWTIRLASSATAAPRSVSERRRVRWSLGSGIRVTRPSRSSSRTVLDTEAGSDPAYTASRCWLGVSPARVSARSEARAAYPA